MFASFFAAVLLMYSGAVRWCCDEQQPQSFLDSLEMHRFLSSDNAGSNLEDVAICKLLRAGTDAVQHEGHALMVLLPDDGEDLVLLREAGRHVVIDVRQLNHELVGIVQDLTGSLVGVLACKQSFPEQE